MKKTGLILAFLVCVISYQGFAGGSTEKKPQKLDENIATKDDLKKMGESIITSMNEEFKKRAAVSPVPATPGSGTAVNISNQGASNRIPVTAKIVQFLLKDDENSKGLKFYISEAIIVKIFESKETAEIEKKNNMIVLNNPQLPDTPKKTTEFTKDCEGVINGFGPENDKGSQIKIRFPEQENRTLIFTRNIQRDNYELTEVEILDDKTRRVDSLVTIHLLVSGSNDRKTELKVMPIEYENINNQQPDKIINNNNSNNNTSTPQPNVNTNRTVNTSRSVMGVGSLNPQRVIVYANKKNRALSNSDKNIINEYFKEASYEGVNVDIAIAQVLYWTDCFKKRERVATNNFCGLSRIDGWNGRFPYKMRDGMIEGVRAHIQHLKAYAKETPKQTIVDPRFKLAFDRGIRGIKFDQVYRIWSEDPRYGQRIENILREL